MTTKDLTRTLYTIETQLTAVRQMIFLQHRASGSPSQSNILTQTAGLLKGILQGNAVELQRNLRAQWDKR